MWEMNLDTSTSKVRMKKITKYKRLFEWESEIYIFNALNMSTNIGIGEIPDT